MPAPEWVAVGLAGLTALLTWHTYGITWDEHVQATYGELVLDYFLSLGRNPAANEYLNLRLYGPLFELLGAIAHRLAGGWQYEVRHLLNTVAGLLALIAAVRFARLFDRRWLPLLTALALAAMPRFYGDWFANSKDIPFACAFAWAMWGMGRLWLVEQRRWRDFLLAGGLIGLALAIRVGALLLFCFLAAGAAVYLAAARLAARGTVPPWRPTVLRAGGLIAVAWLVMVAPWPWAHQSPLLNPLRAFLTANRFASSYPVLFEGRTTLSSELPWYYVPKYLLITTPPAVLALAALGLIAAALAIRRERSPGRLALHALTGLWLVFPVAYVVVSRPNVYDGIRHFLFVMPAIAIVAAFGADWLLTRLPERWRRAGLVAAVAVLLAPVPGMVRLHPYQTAYFNGFAGGLRRACLAYETDYWAASYREAAEWINRQPRPADGRRLRVVVAANRNSRLCAEYYLAPDIELTTLWNAGDPVPQPFDYYVGMTRYGLAHNFADLPVVHAVGREGAAFTLIRAPRVPVAGR